MKALQYSEYGGPEVLTWAVAPEPHAGPGQVRIAVRASSLNPIDWKIFAGFMSDGEPLSRPTGVGRDASGIVDEVGAGVTGVATGQPVFGLGSSTHADFAVLDAWAVKPDGTGWDVAAAAGLTGEAAERGLRLGGVKRGDTVFIDGGSGGVGTAAVQLAVAAGARVIASAGPGNQEYLRGLGAEPVLSGDGVVERVSQLARGTVNAVFDTVGKTPAEQLITLVTKATQVVTIANFAAGATGIQITSGGKDSQPFQALALVAGLLAEGSLVFAVQTLPRQQAADGYSLSQQGHVRGKLVLLP